MFSLKDKPRYRLVRRHPYDSTLDQWQMTYAGYTFSDLRPAYMNKQDHIDIKNKCVEIALIRKK